MFFALLDLFVFVNTDKAIKGHATQADIADRNAMKVQTTINNLWNGKGKSLRAIAQERNNMGVPTPRKTQWTAQAVKNAIARTQQAVM